MTTTALQVCIEHKEAYTFEYPSEHKMTITEYTITQLNII